MCHEESTDGHVPETGWRGGWGRGAALQRNQGRSLQGLIQQEKEPALDKHSRGRGQLCSDLRRAVREICPKVKEKDAAPGWWPEGAHGDLVMGHGARCDSGCKGRQWMSQDLLERKP